MIAIVAGQNIVVSDEELNVAGSVGIYRVDFEFDSSWNGWDKTAVFEGCGEHIENVVFDDKTYVPWEVIQESGWVKIGVSGTKGANVKPTIWAPQLYFNVGTRSRSLDEEPTPSIYAQILELVDEAKGAAEDVETAWNNVTASASTLTPGSSATVTFSNNNFAFGIPQGAKGDTGATGATGATPDFSIGTVSTLAAGQPATASITGTEAAPVLNLGIPQGIKGDNGDVANIASAYSSSATYAVGDYCIYNSQIYRCITAITTAEAWTSGHWASVELGDDVSSLKSALTILDVSNLLTWTQGYYQSNGTTTTQHQFSNMYSNIISAKMFKKIKIFLDTNRQVCLARFNKDTGVFIERTAWTQGYLEVTNDADVAINIATVQTSDITLNDLLTRIKIYSDFSESSEILNSIVKKKHIVYQGWAQATQKPQTYYATYAGVDLAVDDTITAKSGFEVAVVNSSGSTIKVWGAAWTISSALSNANIIIRRANASAEMLLSDTGYLLSNYILEDYDTTNPQCLAYAVYGSTYNVLAEEIRKSLNASKWSGKKAAFVGDSITAGVNTTQGNIYYQLLNAMIGFSSVYADGVAGSCYSATSNYGTSISPISQRWQDIPTDSDLVVIFAGQNDFGHNTPIGTIADTTDISFYGALSVVINGILEANPDVRLVLFTSTHRYGFTSGTYQNDTDLNGEGHTLKDYVDAIKDIAEMYGVPVIDLFSVSSLNPRISTIKSNYVTDGLHPNADGHYLLANRILPLLETM